jgi:hypothetical protein
MSPCLPATQLPVISAIADPAGGDHVPFDRGLRDPPAVDAAGPVASPLLRGEPRILVHPIRY